MLMYSKISQNEINKITNEYFVKNDSIPLPKIIDKQSLKINYCSLHKFIDAYSEMTTEEKSHFSDFKIMFTNSMAQNMKSKSNNEFAKFFSSSTKSLTKLSTENKKIDKYDNSYFENDIKKLNQTQIDILDKYLNKNVQTKEIKQFKLNVENKQKNILLF